MAATTDSDNVNIVVAVTAKETFKVPHVVARIYNPQAADIYRREGIPTVTPTLWAANTMKTMIVNPLLSAVTALGSGEVESVKIDVPKALAGRTVKDLTLPGEIGGRRIGPPGPGHDPVRRDPAGAGRRGAHHCR